MNFYYQLSRLILLFSFVSNILWSQSSQIRFEHITSEDGLSEDVVNCVYQDSKGFLWFGTNDGLNRFDGYNFTIFRASPDLENAISSNLAFAITEDLHGNIWIGTTGAGLNCFDPLTETFSHFRYDPDDSTSLSYDQIRILFTDQKGRIWVGTNKGINLVIPGVTKEDKPVIKHLAIVDDLDQPHVSAIEEDKSGTIWIGTSKGLFKCSPREPNGNFDFEYIALEETRQSGQIRSIKTDHNGMLVIGTTLGLYYQMNYGNEIAFERISDIPSQQCIVVDNDGKIWTGTYKGVLCFEATQRNAPLLLKGIYTAEIDNPHSLNKNVIKSMVKDKTGIIWIGTNGGGVNRFDPGRKPFYHYGRNLLSNGNSYKEIRSILEDSNGDIWIGTEGGGLFWQSSEKDNGNYDNFSLFPSTISRIFVLEEVLEDNQKMLYLGSEDPPFLQKINISGSVPQKAQIVPDISNSVFAIHQDRNQNLWIGTYNGGLFRWMPRADGSYEQTSFVVDEGTANRLSNNIIRDIHEDNQGNIWIGTANGLNRINSDETRAPEPDFKVFKNIKEDQSSLSHNYILDIFESASGQIWIATFGGGLNKLILSADSKIQFVRYLEKDGLPNNSIKSIQEDISGNLWLASNRGLTRFDPVAESFQNYTTIDGLQASEFFEVASTKRSNGELLFGGVNGFNAFYPDAIVGDAVAPVVIFTKLLVDNLEVRPGDKVNGKTILSKAIHATRQITLKYGQNDFSVEFAAMHFAAPQQNQYAYKLEGYHKDWIEVSADKRNATFTNIPHGKYTLLVKAANGDKIWTEQPARLDITIKPPFWLTWYAYLSYASLIVAALWLFRRYTIISVQEKHKLMLEHMERVKLEELNQMKLRFFTNVSHEFRTPLTLIIGPLEHIFEKGRAISQEKLQQQYHYMYKNAKYLLRLVNQLLDFRKLDQGSLNLHVGRDNIVNFINETTGPFEFIASKQHIRYRILNSQDAIYTYFDPNVIEKVMYNLLSNAFKFTPPGGEVSVQILERETDVKSISGPYVEIRVKDEGPGISRKKREKIFERFYKGRAKKENKDGAGIGLAYTKSLVELHHGSIHVESIRGEGACFIVRLPMEKKAYLKSEIDQIQMERFEASSDPLEYLVAEPVSEVPASALVLNREEKEEELPLLLFVDDNSDIRRFIKEGFQNDFRIIEAEDGEKGYEIALSSLPDIIVSDIMMPFMNGIELCEALKTNSLTSHIPIVLLTAKSTKENELEGIKTGADAYVVKPFKLDILRAQLLNIHLQRERLKQRFRQEVILEPKDVTVTSADEEFLKKAMSIIEEHMSDAEFNVEALVKEMYLSRSKLYVKLKALTGQSSSEFMRTVRLKRAVQLLEKSDYTIKEIMYMTGFNTASYFSKCFKNQFGIVPSEYLRKQKELTR